MSRNSKNARRHIEAKQWRRATGSGHNIVSTGNKGPSQTTPKHGKKNAWFQLFDSHGDFMASQKKGAKNKKREEQREEAASVTAEA